MRKRGAALAHANLKEVVMDFGNPANASCNFLFLSYKLPLVETPQRDIQTLFRFIFRAAIRILTFEFECLLDDRTVQRVETALVKQ